MVVFSIFRTWMIAHQDFFHLFYVHVTCGPVWLCMIVLIVIALIPDIILRAMNDINRTKNTAHRRVCITTCL